MEAEAIKAAAEEFRAAIDQHCKGRTRFIAFRALELCLAAAYDAVLLVRPGECGT